MAPITVVYMGTPSFAVPTLEALVALPEVRVPLVLTQPDRPAGRGRKLVAPPVKVAAERLDLPVIQVATLRDEAARAALREAAPDAIVVAAFGLILARRVLELPRVACLNLHASLLPAYRGASPVQAAILNGDPVTGISLMRMEQGLDTGPVYATGEIPIAPDATTESLTDELASLAATVLTANLEAIVAGTLMPTPQPADATIARKIEKADGWLEWTEDAAVLERKVRAMWPWPRAWTTLPDGTLFQIHRARVATAVAGAGQPGAVTLANGEVSVSCGAGALTLETVQLPGGRPSPAAQALRQVSTVENPRLGVTGGPQPRPTPIVTPVSERSAAHT